MFRAIIELSTGAKVGLVFNTLAFCLVLTLMVGLILEKEHKGDIALIGVILLCFLNNIVQMFY